MDLDDFRSILDNAGVDVWTFIDTAILVASLDYGPELKRRRDNLVERLYATSMVTRCRNCDFNAGEIGVDSHEAVDRVEEGDKEHENRREGSVNVDDDDYDDFDPYGGLFDDEQKKILEIKEQLEDPNLSEESLIELLQNLADMDITFKALQETDIGRYVNRVRKHSSNTVGRLAKQLVRKWKETVDEWVKQNQPGDLEPSALMANGEQSGHQQQVLDFGFSPIPQSGSSGSDKNHTELEPEPERKPRPVPLPPRREINTPPKPSRPSPAPQRTQTQRERKESGFDMDQDRLAKVTKRLQENYKEVENAKKQRTIQVMDIHEIPKAKKSFFPKKGGGGGSGSSHGRHW